MKSWAFVSMLYPELEVRLWSVEDDNRAKDPDKNPS